MLDYQRAAYPTRPDQNWNSYDWSPKIAVGSHRVEAPNIVFKEKPGKKITTSKENDITELEMTSDMNIKHM